MSVVPNRLKAALADSYAIEHELGSGGMATVYLAEDLKHHRKVALKVLRPELAAALGSERFLREIEITANLTHPHILPVHDSGQVDGFLYYVMPYVEGQSLRERLNSEKQLPLDDAIRIACEVADALSYAHSHDVVHRDIKPENVLLEEGHAVVADFGIARAITAAGGQKLTETGIAVGTPAYMSPEQASGEQSVDGRSDFYSLGSVLYEMLAGEPPYTGPTAQAVLARKAVEAVPNIRVLRETIPETVEQAIVKALAKVPADRFATATQFIEALTEGSHTPAATSSVRRRAWIGVVAAAIAGAVFFATQSLFRLAQSDSELDEHLIAVTPFDVLGGGDLDIWSEGLVDILSRNLDGVGSLRSVSPSVTIRQWEGRSDRASAIQLANRTGAGLAVYGQLMSTGRDSVLLTASLFDVTRRELLGEVEIRETAERMDRLADSLTLALLHELARTGAIVDAPRISFGSTSLPALKHFLNGERYSRTAQWDSALGYYERAIELDTAFALALARAGNAVGWMANPEDARAVEYGLRAAAHIERLPQRESLLVTIRSLGAAINSAEPAGLEYWSLLRRLFQTVHEATIRYPDDPEIWHHVGDARLHFGVRVGISRRQSYEAFTRAIELDPTYSPSYHHQVLLATWLDGSVAARRYIDQYAALDPTEHVDGIHLTGMLLDTTVANSPAAQTLLDTASADVLGDAVLLLWGYPDSAETAVALTRLLAQGRHGHSPWSTASFGNWLLLRQLSLRGHVREAAALSPESDPKVYSALVLLGGIPAERATATFGRWLQERDLQSIWSLWWWAERRDTVSLNEFINSQDAVLGESAYRPFFEQAAPAYLALARADTAEGLARFAALPDSLCTACPYERLTRARLLVAAGRDREAKPLLDPWTWPGGDRPPHGLVVVVALEWARLNERLGNRDTAIDAYGFVADMWQHADDLLQSFVSEAREALQRLTGESR